MSAFAWRTTTRSPRALGLAPGALGAQPVDIVIWTTTPWTLPANQAVALKPEFTYVLAEAHQGASVRRLILAAELLEPSLKRYGMGEARVLARAEGRALEGLKLHASAAAARGAGDPRRARDARCRHRRGAHRAGATVRRTSPSASATGSPVLNPVGNDGRFLPGTPLVAGLQRG